MTRSLPTTESDTEAIPRRGPRWLVPSVLLVIVVAAVAISMAFISMPAKKGSARSTHAAVKETATNFTAATLDKSSSLTLSQFRGRPVVLNFWASWCVPCQAEFGTLKAMHGQYSGVEMIGILTQDNATDGSTFARKQHADWPLVYDRGQRISANYKVTSLPQTVFINGNGVIVDRVFGRVTTTDFKRNLG